MLSLEEYSKIVRPFLAALSVNGLNRDDDPYDLMVLWKSQKKNNFVGVIDWIKLQSVENEIHDLGGMNIYMGIVLLL